jgi:pyrophosphate--fructose-6-phosphate 1-phosphotransferase
MIGADKVLVQKSGYFARSAPANDADLVLIGRCVEHAIECALRGESGLIGEDEDQAGRLRPIEFSRVKGGKEFDVRTRWFQELLVRTGQKTARKRKAS